MNVKKKTAAVALAAVFAIGTCGALAGCDALTVQNLTVDYNRTVATVNIGTSDAFTKEDGEFKGLDASKLIGDASIAKRELVMSFISNGSTLVQSYGMSVEQAFDFLLDNLIQREVNVQYAKAYFCKQTDNDYNVADYVSAVGAAANTSDAKKEQAGLAYFLDDDEQAKALYDLRVAINSAIDNQEQGLIKAVEDDHDHTADSDVRTLPTGAETVKDDYFDTEYRIYTGKETALGSYEKLDGSTVATRKAAYNLFISNLYSGDQLKKGEDTTKIEETDYFARQLILQYKSALLTKLSDAFEEEEVKKLDKDWAKTVYDNEVNDQRAEYSNNKSAFEDAFNAVSDSSFVFIPYNYNYGYVLNILLPFSTLQTEELSSFTNDLGDAKGAKYAARARLLQKVQATDQRGTWFTGHENYSYEAEGFTGGNEDRSYLFFENSFTKSDDVKDATGKVTQSAQYEKIKNYLGKYTYNGTVEPGDEEGEVKKTNPNRIDIDGFLAEMKGYMTYANSELGKDYKDADLKFVDLPDYNNGTYKANYFTRESFYYTEEDKAEDPTIRVGQVNYDSFIYEIGKIGYFTENKFDPNRMFVSGTPENVAFSVINELSFAYNTDTAGLNSYLGYMISPYQTSYMKEFEYAAQLAVRLGAGSYVVVPTDYGWHIIYCTFSFADINEGDAAFTFNAEEAEGDNEVENSFSYLYFEQLKSGIVDTQVSRRQNKILEEYVDDCSHKNEGVYKDLLRL